MYLLHFDAKTVLLIDLSFSARNWDDLAVRGERRFSIDKHIQRYNSNSEM